MKLENTFPKNKIMIGVAVLVAILSVIAAIFYGPPNIHNPFLVLAMFFLLRAAVQVFTFREGRQSERLELLENSIIHLSMVITSVLLVSFCIPAERNMFIGMFVMGIVAWMFAYGAVGAVVSGLGIWAERNDSRDFRAEMKETAEKARMEQALVADLADFLADTDSTNSDSDIER